MLPQKAMQPIVFRETTDSLANYSQYTDTRVISGAYNQQEITQKNYWISQLKRRPTARTKYFPIRFLGKLPG
jgi:IS1 family transposase